MKYYRNIPEEEVKTLLLFQRVFACHLFRPHLPDSRAASPPARCCVVVEVVGSGALRAPLPTTSTTTQHLRTPEA